MTLNKPRFIGSASPFKGWAEKYFSSGYSPIPLPPNQKNPPPTGWTGHGRPFVDQERLDAWLRDEDLRCFSAEKNKVVAYTAAKANIAIRLNTVVVNGVTYDLVAIDVDHHPEDENDPKDGGTQLISLQRQLGDLPETWINSARDNGISGQRFYRAPTGLAWRGDCGASGPDIDILSKNYRFAACFPSTNPDAKDAQYWWYPPGFAPNGDVSGIDRESFGWIPDPSKLPLLPDAWINFLTNNRIPDFGVLIDMDSTNNQLKRWSIKHFGKPAEMCEYMRMTADKWIIKLQQSAKNHNVLTKAHYHILKCGAQEHHHGWLDAIKEFEKAYEADCLDKGKRGGNIRTIKREIERSRFGALRRIKGEADEAKAAGRSYFDSLDPCDLVRNSPVFQQLSAQAGVDDGGDDNDPPIHFNDFPHTPAKDPEKYEDTDWGNANHFSDLHQGLIKYVVNGVAGWLIWSKDDRWISDRKGAIPRALFVTRVKTRQVEQGQKMLMAAFDKATETAAKSYLKFAKQSGNLTGIRNALELASTLQDISIKQEELDSDRRALGCANGVVKWGDDGAITLIENTRDLLITKNTGIPYVPLKEQAAKDSSYYRGYVILGKFLKAVQPERDRRDYLQKLLGQCLMGSNPYKIAMFFYGPKNTGKTTLLELMIDALGGPRHGYAAMRPPRIYQPKDLHPLLASSLPMRIIGTDELGSAKMGSELFKTITGNGTVTVELKGSNVPVEDQPQFTPIITTNTVPSVPGEDAAFRDRLVVIPFVHDVANHDGDPFKFRHDLEKYCAPAMLAWLIEGCERAIKEGIRPEGKFPEWIVKATGEFASQMSDTGVFLREHVRRTDDLRHFVPNSSVWSAFRSWAQTNGFDERNMNSENLSKALIAQGFWRSSKRYRFDGELSRGWLGMKLVNGKEEVFKQLDEPGIKR